MTAALLAAQSSPSLQQHAIVGDRQGDAGRCWHSARGDHPCLRCVLLPMLRAGTFDLFWGAARGGRARGCCPTANGLGTGH